MTRGCDPDGTQMRRHHPEGVAALRANNIDAHRRHGRGREADGGRADPRRRRGAPAKAKTLQDAGLSRSSSSQDLRLGACSVQETDRQTQGREIRKLVSAPDYMLGSVQAIPESGDLVVASASASQIGP